MFGFINLTRKTSLAIQAAAKKLRHQRRRTIRIIVALAVIALLFWLLAGPVAGMFNMK
jgi:hypothetical protein